jgi:hypothetical protein
VVKVRNGFPEIYFVQYDEDQAEQSISHNIVDKREAVDFNRRQGLFTEL